MTFGLTNVTKAQVRNSEVLFFESGGARYDDDNTIAVLRFKDGKLYCVNNRSKGYVKSRLKNSKTYYDSFPKGENAGIYLYDKSKGEYYLYEYESTYNKPNTSPRSYIAVSKDLSSLVTFSVDGNGKAYDKCYFNRISKEEILPQALNTNEFDFLNE